MNKDQLLAQVAQKSTTTARTLHKMSLVDGNPAPELSFAWFAAAGLGDYTFYPINDAETHAAITEALMDGTIRESGQFNTNPYTLSKGEKLILAST